MSERQTKVVAEPGTREIVITRTFDAPRELVFRIITDPQLIPGWWGPSKYTTKVERMDVRPGGGWRFVQHDADGTEFAFRGEYREVAPPDRLVQTFEWEAMPGHVSVETLVLEECEGKTYWTSTSVFDTVEDRDGMVQSGMEEGVDEGYNRLAAILARNVRGEQAGGRREAA